MQTTQSKTTITGMDANYYMVKDLEAAKKFYRDTLGLTVTFEIPDTVCEFTFAGGETFGLYKSPEGTWSRGTGVMFGVPDINATIELLKSKGVKFDDNGAVEETPVCFMAFAEDSEGNKFMLHQKK